MAKRRSYFIKVLSETWKETEILEVVVQDIGGGVVTVALALLLKVAKLDEIWELLFLAVVGGLCGVILSFFYRLIFVTPIKLDKEKDKKIRSLQSKLEERGNEQPINQDTEEKQIYRTPLAITLLICLCSGLALLLIMEVSKNGKPTENTVSKPLPPPRPLPTQTIPRPESAPIVSTQKVAFVENNQQFENFDSNKGVTNDIPTSLQKLKSIKEQLAADKAAKEEIDRQNQLAEIKRIWSFSLPHYKHFLVVLHDALIAESAKTSDGIAQSEGYFQCLPGTIDPQVKDLKVAEIKFQKNTNMDFFITISELVSGKLRRLKISCDGGWVSVDLGWSGDVLCGTLHANIDEGIDEPFTVPADKAGEQMADSVGKLISAQRYILSNNAKDKADTNIAAKPQ